MKSTTTPDRDVGSSDSSASDEDAFNDWNRDIDDYVPTLWDAYLFGLARAKKHTLAAELQFGDAVRIARGCRDYGGGYRSDADRMLIYQHGIETVITALEAAQKRGLQDTQVAALHAMGKPNS